MRVYWPVAACVLTLLGGCGPAEGDSCEPEEEGEGVCAGRDWLGCDDGVWEGVSGSTCQLDGTIQVEQ